MEDRQPMLPLEDISSTAPLNDAVREPLQQALGKPATKTILHWSDAIATIISLVCLIIALLAVVDENYSWRLGIENRQLIVLGFLLSIMNLCLASVTPKLFLLLEARLGPSVLQNFDAIIRNSPAAPKLSIAWRLLLTVMLALPIALSIAYKTFVGGESAAEVNPMDYVPRLPYYGMYSPPGQQYLGGRLGLSIFANATLPFLVASSGTGSVAAVPPVYPKTYGYNIISINNETTAILDIPQPEYLASAQEVLADGESWRVSAWVVGTVATLNRSKTEDPDAFASSFLDACPTGSPDEGNTTSVDWTLIANDMHNWWSFLALQESDLSNQSIQYTAVQQNFNDDPECSDFLPAIEQFFVNRQYCYGEWLVTRGDIHLEYGNCSGGALPPELQTMITMQESMVGLYTPFLTEILLPFSNTSDTRLSSSQSQPFGGNQSLWYSPSLATSVVGMVWSRISGLNAPAQFDPRDWDQEDSTIHNGTLRIYRGVVYQANHTVLYVRPTLRKAPLFYFVLAIQPLLTVLVILLTMLFYSTPIDRGFGLVSILSGVDRQSLDALAGAGLSGVLLKPVHLIMRPVRKGQHGVVEYRVSAASDTPLRNSRLSGGVVYQ